MSFPFNFIASTNIPEETILLVPPVTKVIVENTMTGEITEHWEWNAEGGAVITDVKSPKNEAT